MFILFLAALLLSACGQSYEEKKRISRQQRIRQLREDSAALKVAVMPTLDCLPLFVAKDCHLFDTLGADVRLKLFNAQMDCDTAISHRRVEVVVSDLVRIEHLIDQGTPLEYLTSTGAYWQLITNRSTRIRQLKGLDDKMVAMTRYSVTDLLADLAVDSAGLKPERVFKVQVNDVNIRLRMLQNNEMDALLLTEPQATEARIAHHRVLLDTRQMDMNMGVMAVAGRIAKDSTRQLQLEVLRKGYNLACDSLNKYGIGHYQPILSKYYGLKSQLADSLPRNFKFAHYTKPRDTDKERARKWLDKTMNALRATRK